MKKKYLALFLPALAVVLIISFLKSTVNKKPTQLPSGFLYFSNGVEIEKLNLRTKKREILIKGMHDDNPTHSVWPVYDFKKRRMYYFRSYTWPHKCEFVTYDLSSQKIEKIEDFCGDKLSLSPDGNRIAYYKGGEFISPQHQDRNPVRLFIRNLVNDQEWVMTEDVDLYTNPPRWISIEELIYRNTKGEWVQINQLKIKKIWADKKFSSIGPSSATRNSIATKFYLFFSKILIIDTHGNTLKSVSDSLFFVNNEFIWSPDDRSFIYTRHGWRNFLPFHETGNLYWHDMGTNSEIKLLDKAALFGGFWLSEDLQIQLVNDKDGASLDI